MYDEAMKASDRERQSKIFEIDTFHGNIFEHTEIKADYDAYTLRI